MILIKKSVYHFLVKISVGIVIRTEFPGGGGFHMKLAGDVRAYRVSIFAQNSETG